MPIQDLKPLESVLVYRSNCASITRVAFGIAVSVHGEELGANRPGTKTVQTCHPIPSNSRQRPNDNRQVWTMTEKVLDRRSE